MARSPRLKPEHKTAAVWKQFYATDGRVALAALFTEFGLYSMAPTSDPNDALRREGQRDVLLRIVQLIGLKPEMLVEQAWEDSDILDRMMNTQ